MITAAESCRRDRRARTVDRRFHNRGLGCLNNRHYDPNTGTFLSVDPLVTMTGEPYIYGSANPVTYSDPSGLCSVSESFCSANDAEYIPGGGGSSGPVFSVVDDLGRAGSAPDSWVDGGPWRSGEYRDQILGAAGRAGIDWNLLAAILDREALSLTNFSGREWVDQLVDSIKILGEDFTGRSTSVGVAQLQVGAVGQALDFDPGLVEQYASGRCRYHTCNRSQMLWLKTKSDKSASIDVAASFVAFLEAGIRSDLSSEGIPLVSSAPSSGEVVYLSTLVAARYRGSPGTIDSAVTVNGLSPGVSSSEWYAVALVATERMRARGG